MCIRDSIIEDLNKIHKLVNDNFFKKLCSKIEYSAEDFGKEKIQDAIAYICENYQFEKSIIRNRRDDEEDNNVRELEEISYDMQTNFNNIEYNVYKSLASWIEMSNTEYDTFMLQYKKIIAAFFSLN